MMTAREAGGLVAGGVWGTLRRLRDQWMLLVFAASALFWARDVYERFVDLPARVAELGTAVDELRVDVRRNGAGHSASGERQEALPSNRALSGWVLTDGARGDRCDRDCMAVADGAGRGRGAGKLPAVLKADGSREPAFGVTVRQRAAIGRSELLVTMSRSCGASH